MYKPYQQSQKGTDQWDTVMCEEIHPILTFACVCVNTTYSPPNIKSGTVTAVYHNTKTGRKYNKGYKYIFLTTTELK